MSQRPFIATALVQAYRRQPGSRLATASLLFVNLEFLAFLLPLFWEPLTSSLFGLSLGDPKLVFLGVTACLGALAVICGATAHLIAPPPSRTTRVPLEEAMSSLTSVHPSPELARAALLDALEATGATATPGELGLFGALVGGGLIVVAGAMTLAVIGLVPLEVVLVAIFLGGFVAITCAYLISRDRQRRQR